MGSPILTVAPVTHNMYIRAVVCATLLTCTQGLFKYPWHASCKIQWEIPQTCSHFRDKIVDQMNAWQGDSMCPTTSPSCPELPCGQNCLYQVQETSENFISGTHQTPVARYTDNLTFRLTLVAQVVALWQPSQHLKLGMLSWTWGLTTATLGTSLMELGYLPLLGSQR